MVRDDVEQDDHSAEDDHEYAEGSNPLELSVSEQASGDDESHGEIIFFLEKPTNRRVICIRREYLGRIERSCPEGSN